MLSFVPVRRSNDDNALYNVAVHSRIVTVLLVGVCVRSVFGHFDNADLKADLKKRDLSDVSFTLHGIMP